MQVTRPNFAEFLVALFLRLGQTYSARLCREPRDARLGEIETT
jgi:hypothetical protein